MGRKKLQIEGCRFGKLVVVSGVNSQGGPSKWLCLCDCGETIEVIGKRLTRSSGGKSSCGCADLRRNSVSNPTTKSGLRTRLISRTTMSGDGCLIWCGATYKGGYGRVSVDGTNMAAHRLSYEIFNGPIPDGLHVLHRCDVPGCINPEHLFVGSHQDNMKDMLNKGRHGGGGKRR